MFTDQSDNLGLLLGGAATTDDGRARRGQLHEFVLVELEADLQRVAFDDEAGVLQGLLIKTCTKTAEVYE